MAAGENLVRPDVLTCWKDIAQYMGKGVRTVQRWERDFGLPIWRPSGAATKSSIVAHTRELDEWVQQRWSDRTATHDDHKPFELGDLPPEPPLSRSIRTAHQLRETNHALIHEISAVLASLIQNCDQLISTQQIFPRPAQLSLETESTSSKRVA